MTSFRSRLALSLRSAAVTTAAALVTLAVAVLLDPEPGPAIFGMLLAVSLSRSQLERDLRGRLEAGLVLPLVALMGAGVGALLVSLPWLGALVFTLAVTLSVYLRRFGELWRRIGGLIALPFTVLLVAPLQSERLGPGGSLLVTLAVGVTAWIAVTVLQLAAARLGALTPASVRPPAPSEGSPSPRTPPRLDATTRLAVQMGAAVGIAFVVGYLVFPDRWSWIVLTALLVTVGNAGRADVTHKAVQRVIGAGVGSVIALVPLLLPHPAPVVAIGIALVALFAGLAARPFGYLWWTLAVTVVLALAQSVTAGRFSLLERWEEIALGAVIAVAVAWLLLPVRSESTVRRRLADLLSATADWLEIVTAPERAPDAGDADAPRARVDVALARVTRVAAPFDAARRWLPPSWRPRACGWLDTTRSAVALLLDRPRIGARRPLGAVRRSLRAPDELQAALDALLEAASGS
ncbi:FUSC family protein [Microbacterium sp.]|uniref:FUSC family protein n=1 Tax=Microbacterium sp. TaxID=51671 RepID=UPI001AD5DAD4|nr:FUSC family protein [Microbacterium sp.]MBN9193106.1 FUSC family protein [Microbacterium sp.]